MAAYGLTNSRISRLRLRGTGDVRVRVRRTVEAVCVRSLSLKVTSAGSELGLVHEKLESTRSFPSQALALVLLMTLSLASVSEAVCIASRSPDRDLWIEVVSCSDHVLQEVSDELFLQALVRTDEDWTRHCVPSAAKLLRERPGLLIVAREHAFADSGLAFSKRTPRGTYEAAFSGRPGEWQSSGAQPERRFFLQTAQATCWSPGCWLCKRSSAAVTPVAGRNWGASFKCPS